MTNLASCHPAARLIRNPNMNPTDTTEVHESSDSSSSAEEVPAYATVAASQPPPPKSYAIVRALIAAFVACINTHCNGVGANDADVKIGAFKAQLADDRDAAGDVVDESSPLTELEEDHLDSIFAQVKTNPSPITRLPDAPDFDAEPTPEPVDTRPAPYPAVGGGIALSPERPEENVPEETAAS